MHRVRTVKKILTTIALSISASVAVAGGTITGTVQLLIARASDGLTYVVINGTASGHPACATNSYWIIMNETSDAGHKQYAMLLAAQASGSQVSIVGAGTCTRWGDGEDIDYIEIYGQ
jgi:hypothetical protein